MNKPTNAEDLRNKQYQWNNIARLIYTVFCGAMSGDATSNWWRLPTQLVNKAFSSVSQSNFSEHEAPWFWHRTFILNMLDGNLEPELAPYSLVGEAGKMKTRVVRFPEFDTLYPYDFFVKALWQDVDILLAADVMSFEDITRITDRHCPACDQFVETSDFLDNNWSIAGRVDGNSKWGYVVEHHVCP